LFILGRIITIIIAVVITVAAIAAGYMIYLSVNGARLPDKEALTVAVSDEGALPGLQTGREYRALTYNLGFGAYDHAYSFFMSEGKTLDGDETKGLMSRALDEDSVRENMRAAIAAALGQQPDLAIFQEVDRDAGRSYKVDELQLISSAFGDGIAGNGEGEAEGDDAGESGGSFAATYATNFHSGWLLWPPARPMGMIKDSGIATYSRYRMDSAERRSLPVDDSFPGKFFDLDRCFTVSRLPVGGAEGEEGSGPGGELVLVNVHLSAYEAGDKIHGEQMKALAEIMKEERAKDNWVIVGGDWNQCFPGSLDAFNGRMETPSWAKPLEESVLPDGFSMINADNANVIATCRDTSIPWTPGVSYETIIDGWIVSDNVAAASENIDTDYIASDHNPVLLTFTLRG
jgi:endonuclease/exonuclease/phosphatase family metal-dependent hydrolase